MSTHTNTTPVIVHARVPAALLNQLRVIAEREDRSLSAEVRRGLTLHVKHLERGEAADD